MQRNFNSLTIFSSVQWLFFIFANTVVVPISLGSIFQLPTETIAMMLRSSLILTGVACILQGWIGHRYPLMEGHSGLLWGVMLNLGISASALGMSFEQIGGGIATGILLAGVVTVFIAVFNLIEYVQKIFSPMVTSVYLFLLTFQLIFIFFQGMLKVSDDGSLNVPVSLLSVGIVILVSLLKIKGNAIIGNFSILIGIVVGWVLYVLLFPQFIEQPVSTGFTISLFPLGQPNLQYGIVAVAFFAGVLNLSNTIASIRAAASLFKEEAESSQYRKSFFLTGLFAFVSPVFGLVPYTPFTSSIGFLQSTRILQKEPFFLGGGMLVIIGLIPPFGDFLSTMPVTIGNAVLFVAYLQLFGTAYNSLNGTVLNSFTVFRVAGPVLLGVCLLNISPEILSSVPILLQPFISNGLIMGVVLSILMETCINWEKIEQRE